MNWQKALSSRRPKVPLTGIGKKPQCLDPGKMMFRVSLQLHRKAALAAELAGKSLNHLAREALSEVSA